MLNKLSSRQKARGALSLLNLTPEERSSLDSIVSDTMGNPFVGAVLGVDVISLEELVIHGFDSMQDDLDDDESMVSTLRDKLTQPKVRQAVASGVVKALNTLSESNQKHALNVLVRISEMDFPEFDKEFKNIEDFISNGLLNLVARKTEVTNFQEVVVCENCSHTMLL